MNHICIYLCVSYKINIMDILFNISNLQTASCTIEPFNQNGATHGRRGLICCTIRQKKDYLQSLNTLRPRQNGRHFPDDIFKWIFLNEYVWISINISLKFVPRGPINNIPTLVQVMAWRRPGHRPLSEPIMSILIPVQSGRVVHLKRSWLLFFNSFLLPLTCTVLELICLQT